MAPKKPLGLVDRAVYELVRQGLLTPAHVPLYAAPLRALVAAGLIKAGPDGKYVDLAPTLRLDVDPVEPMVPFVLRIPSKTKEALGAAAKAAGSTPSELARELIDAGLASRKARKR